MSTCRPWKPVPKKNVEPAFPSEMFNHVVWYSTPCQKVKISASQIVACRLDRLCLYRLHIKQWWQRVTVAPDDNSKTVLNHGTPHVLMRSMLLEGQTHQCMVDSRYHWAIAPLDSYCQCWRETLSKVQHVVDNLSPMAEGLYFLATMGKPRVSQEV